MNNKHMKEFIVAKEDVVEIMKEELNHWTKKNVLKYETLAPLLSPQPSYFFRIYQNIKQSDIKGIKNNMIEYLELRESYVRGIPSLNNPFTKHGFKACVALHVKGEKKFLKDLVQKYIAEQDFIRNTELTQKHLQGLENLMGNKFSKIKY